MYLSRKKVTNIQALSKFTYYTARDMHVPKKDTVPNPLLQYQREKSALVILCIPVLVCYSLHRHL